MMFNVRIGSTFFKMFEYLTPILEEQPLQEKEKK